MLRELVVIKLGGSVITNKLAPKPTPRLTTIRNLAGQLGKIHLSDKKKIVLVHGGGSYGHPFAKKYNLHKGMKTVRQKIGFSKTLNSMLKLNDLIVSELIENSIPAVGLPPHSFVVQSAGILKKFDGSLVEFYLNSGLVPVLFGDGVLDDKWGCSILSGDTIATYLAQRLQAKKVLFLSDVDGIYEQDPKINPHTKRIDNLDNYNLQQVLDSIALKNKTDVTGEMRGKILSIKNNLRGIEVVITSGLQGNNLIRAIQGHMVGTRLFFN